MQIQVTVFFPRTKHHDHPIHWIHPILLTNPFQNLCLLKQLSWELPNQNFMKKCFKKENTVAVKLGKPFQIISSFLNIYRDTGVYDDP